MNINPFASENVEFTFRVPVDSAVESLKQSVSTSKQVTEQETMVGSVSQNDTYVYRGVPRTRNSFRPTFYGSFDSSESGAVLKGNITLNRVIQKFLKIWLAIAAFAALATIVSILTNPSASWTSMLQLIIPLVLVLSFCIMLMNKCASDVEWLKKSIIDAVENN